MANLLGGCAALLARWIQTGLSVGQPIDQEVVVLQLVSRSLQLWPDFVCNLQEA